MVTPNPSPFLDLMRRYRKLFWWESIFFIVLGLAALITPVLFSLTLDYFLGALCILAAIAIAIRSFKTPDMPNRSGTLLTLFLYWVIGILLIVYPRSGILTLDLLLGIFFVIDGSNKIYAALQIRQDRVWGWLLFSGCLSLILAGLIFASWPAYAASVLGILVGINILFTGLSQIGLLLNISHRE